MNTLVRSLAAILPLLAGAPAHASLQGRDLDGNLGTAEAYFDTVLGITWLADADLAQTSHHQFQPGQDLPGGQMTWMEALSWAAQPYGVSGWRLPKMLPDPATAGCIISPSSVEDCRFTADSPSEMRSLLTSTLGVGNTGPFQNLHGNYWTSQEYDSFLPFPGGHYPAVTGAWNIDSATGTQAHVAINLDSLGGAWWVHDGDIGVSAAVPEPDTAAMAVMGLLFVSRSFRRRAAP